MSGKQKSTSNWRSSLSYFSTAVSISMVVYVLGLLGFILLKAKTLTDQTKEQFRFEIYLRDGIKEIEIMQFKKTLDAEEVVIRTVFKDKDAALKEFQESVNAEEDFMFLLGKNPLPQNIDVFFEAAYTHPDSVKKFQAKVADNPLVSDFRYPSDLLYLVHNNVEKISIALIAIGALLFFVAFALINNTIRLRVYAQRFLIRTMQLVGASNSYIRRPFLWRAIGLGFISGILAVVAFAGSLNLMYDYWPEVAKQLIDFKQDVQLYAGMLLISITITWISTVFAVTRFLHLKTEKLYY